MSTLLPPPPKNRTYGFVVVDARTGSPLSLQKGGLFMPSESASFFRIIERKHREYSTTRPRQLDYVAARNRVEKAIKRHLRIVSRLRASSMTRDWERTKTAAAVKPKIKSVKSNPS